MKKINFFIFSLLAIFLFSFSVPTPPSFSIAWAEDEEEQEDEKDEEDEEDEEDEKDDEEKSSDSESKTTITYVPVTTIIKRLVTLKDSDGDGIEDPQDPHPSVAEIYVVKDENFNGVVDQFEVIP